MTELDHLVVAAHTLEQGLAHVRASLGIDLPTGGPHPRMGTHNHLLRLGDALFLEVIAIDPSAAAPARPRWFQLDDPALASELRSSPRLLTWVVRTRHIAEVFLGCSRPLGAIEAMERGDLRWLITFAGDGAVVDGGMMPLVIQWPAGPHPASRMAELGFALDRLVAMHPDPASYRRDLASIGAEGFVEVQAIAPGARPRLIARIRTPDGVRILE